MNTRTTLIVLVIALLMGVYFLVFETDMFGLRRETTLERERQYMQNPPTDGAPVFEVGSFQPGGVNAIRIQRPGEPDVLIARDADDKDKWSQTEPVTWELQKWSVDDLANGASSLQYMSTVTPGSGELTLESLGLAPAIATVTFSGETVGDDPKPFAHTIKLGRRIAGGRAYAQIGEQDTVLVVNDALHNRLVDKSVVDLRSKSLPSTDVGRIARITRAGGGQTLVLEQNEGRWRMIEPHRCGVDEEQAKSLANAVANAWVNQFVADNPADLTAFGLAQPTVTLTLDITSLEPVDDKAQEQDKSTESEAGETVKLTIGAARDLKGDYHLAMLNDRPVVFTVPQSTIDKLGVEAAELRVKKLTDAAATRIHSIRVGGEAAKGLAVVKQAGVWTFEGADVAYRPDAEAVGRLAAAIAETEATGVYRSGDDAEGQSATLTLGIEGRAEPVVLNLRVAEDQVHATGAADTIGNTFDREPLADLFADPLTLRDRTVLDLGPDDIVSLRVIRTGEFLADITFQRLPGELDKGTEERNTLGEWALDGMNREAFDRLLGMLTPLRAEGWVTESQMYIPEGVTLHIGLTDGPMRTVTIHPGPAEAELAGLATPFKVSRAFVSAAEAEFRDPVAMSIDIDQIASVTNGGVTVERDRNAVYHLVGGQDAELHEASAGAMFDTLAGLRVEYWLPAEGPGFAPTDELVIRTRDGQTLTLKIALPSNWDTGRAIAQIDDGDRFTLIRDVAEKLTAKLTHEPQK